jgi:exosortase E/protease (VPEID-CTERM system)
MLLEGNPASGINVTPWLGAWITLAFVSMGLWILAVFPPVMWIAIGVPPFRILAMGSLVAMAAVAAGEIAKGLWQPLARGTFWLVERLIGVFYAELVVEPNDLVIGTSSFSVAIAPVCSGYEGMGLIAVFIGAFLWWFRQELKFPQAFLLLLVGIGAIWIANAFRIAALIAIGSSLSRSVALGGFHSQAGWLAFNAVALGVIAMAWNSPAFAKNIAPPDVRRTRNPTAPYLVPFLVLVLTAMMTGAFSNSAFDRLYPARVVTTVVALGYFLHTYCQRGILRWGWSWPSAAIGVAVFSLWMLLEPLAPVDDSSRTLYANSLASMPPMLFVFWISCRVIGSEFIVPIVEELAFRGFLTRRLINEDFERVPMGQFTWFSFLVTSVVFGLLHGRWVAGTLAGMLFAAALYRRGRLTDAVVAHATANALVTGYVLATKNWAAWS